MEQELLSPDLIGKIEDAAPGIVRLKAQQPSHSTNPVAAPSDAWL
jgi:hypothetical protein